MFDKAAEHLKNPKVTFTDYRLYRTKSGRYPGAVYVKPNDSDGWYARIEVDGSLTLNSYNSPPQEMMSELSKFNSNPLQYVIDFGLETGNCCFCSRSLTDQISVRVGYGPICADKYGLPYG